MKRLLTFRTKLLDTQSFLAGIPIPAGAVFEYFRRSHDSDDNDMTKEDEEQVIKWLLATGFKDMLLEELGVQSDAFVDCSVKQPVIENPQSKPGDIDLLICPGRRPDLAIAFQCKPIIVRGLNEEEDDDLRKLGHITDLVVQANLQRRKYGFYRNYLAILIKVDGRKKESYAPLFRGANPDTFQAIYEFPDRENIHEDVGIVFIEIVQPTGKSFNQYVMVAICIDRKAARLSQTASLTNRIEDLMRRKGVIVS